MGKVGYYIRSFENPLDGETLYTVRLKNYSTIDKNDIVALAQKDSNLNAGDLAIGFSAMQQAINDFVLNGHSVTLDGIGCFTLSCKTGIWDTKKNKWKSAGKTSMEDVSSSDIKAVYVRFRPCTLLRQQMAQTKFFSIKGTKFGTENGIAKD